MSVEEIRTQKALALLERTEAESEVRNLEAKIKALADRLSSLGKALEMNPLFVLNMDVPQNADLSIDQVRKIVEEFKAAKAKLADAQAKAKHFGL